MACGIFIRSSAIRAMSALDGDARARCAHGDADISRRQRRGVVDPIPGHGHNLTRLLELADDSQLVLRQQISVDFGDAGLFGNRPAVRRSSPVSITTRRTPLLRSSRIISAAFSRIESAMPKIPTAAWSTATITAVFPVDFNSANRPDASAGTAIPSRPSGQVCPPRSGCPGSWQ